MSVPKIDTNPTTVDQDSIEALSFDQTIGFAERKIDRRHKNLDLPLSASPSRSPKSTWIPASSDPVSIAPAPHAR